MNHLLIISDIISEQFGVSKSIISSSSNLVSDLNLTQLEIIDLIAQLSKKLKFHIPDRTDINSITTIDDVLTFIDENLEDL